MGKYYKFVIFIFLFLLTQFVFASELKSVDSFFVSLSLEGKKDLNTYIKSLESIKNKVEPYILSESRVCSNGRDIKKVSTDGSILTKRKKLGPKAKRQCLNNIKTFQLDYLETLFANYVSVLKLKHKKELILLDKQKNESIQKLQKSLFSNYL